MTRNTYAAIVLSLLFCVFGSSCGTIRCLEDDRNLPIERRGRLVYGGVGCTWQERNHLANSGGTYLDQSLNQCTACCLTPFYVVDSALCVIADTVLLPYTVRRTTSRNRELSRIRSEREKALENGQEQIPDPIVPFDPSRPFQGNWKVFFGDPAQTNETTSQPFGGYQEQILTLYQNANSVTGVPYYQGGTISGQVDGLTFRGNLYQVAIQRQDLFDVRLKADGMSARGSVERRERNNAAKPFSVLMERNVDTILQKGNK